MINIHTLTFNYQNNIPLFSGFDLRISRGETWAILGPSGCGKTTLLYLLAGLRKPTSGQISIDGEVLTRPRPHSGLILQDYGLLPWSTVYENVELGIRVRDFYGPDGKHAPNNYLPKDNIDHWLSRLGQCDQEFFHFVHPHFIVTRSGTGLNLSIRDHHGIARKNPK